MSPARRLILALLLGFGLCLLLTVGMLRSAGEPVAARSNRSAKAGFPFQELALAYEPNFSSTLLLPDPRIAALMDRVTTDTLAAYERALTGIEAVTISGRPYTITTRYSYSGEPISRATRYAYEQLENLGLPVTFHEYTWAGNAWRNVVAERRGLRHPEQVYLITAHLDDLPSGAVAPGADDNASGSTAVLVAADLLGQQDLARTVRFVLFTGEEQYLRGSAAYAADLLAAGEELQGVLNFDMIAYNSDADPVVELHAQSGISGSLALAQTFSQVVAAYGLELAPDIRVDAWLGNYSDNKSFWDRGYPAILAIQDWDDLNPNFHTTRDTLDRLDLDYFVACVRAGVGTLAHLSGLVGRGWLSGTVTAKGTGLPLSATVTALASTHVHTTPTRADGTYSLSLPVDVFTLQAEADPSLYRPVRVTEILILTETTTVQHFQLPAWPERLFLPLLLK